MISKNMLKISKIVMSAAAMLALSPFAHARQGTDSGGGGAGFARSLPVFFLSRDPLEPVTACIEAAPDFGIPTEEVVPMITRGFKKWADYIVEKDLYFGVPRAIYAQTNLQLRAKCQGDENLTFFLGVDNAEIRDYREKLGEDNLFGLAQITQKRKDEWVNGQTQKTQDARGFVWIAPRDSVDAKEHVPTWTAASAPALEGLILHELGHVFGNEEIKGTVMTPELANFLYDDTRPGNALSNLKYYSKIDSQIELVTCLRCQVHYGADDSQSLTHFPDQQFDKDPENTFHALTGQVPQGPVRMSFDRKVGLSPGSGYLTLQDDKLKQRFLVEVRGNYIEVPDNVPLFLGLGGTVQHKLTISYDALILTTDQKPGKPILEVTVNYNADSKKMIIKEKSDIRAPDHDFYGRILFRSAD